MPTVIRLQSWAAWNGVIAGLEGLGFTKGGPWRTGAGYIAGLRGLISFWDFSMVWLCSFGIGAHHEYDRIRRGPLCYLDEVTPGVTCQWDWRVSYVLRWSRIRMDSFREIFMIWCMSWNTMNMLARVPRRFDLTGAIDGLMT